MNKISSIAKNTSYLTIALILQKVISFAYFAILARNLGPEYLGKYYFAISFTTIFAIFIDLGFINFLTREVAKRQKEAPVLLGNILSFKILLSFATIILSLVVINLFNHDALTKELVYISMISMVLDSFTTTFFAVVRGFHNLKYESIASVLFQVIVFVFGIGALELGLNLRYVMLALASASIFNFIFSLAVLSKKIKIKIRLVYNDKIFKSILKISWPFALFAIFQRLYTYLDSVLLSLMAGDYFVGLYQVAFKIIFALQFLPMAFIASLYPAMSYYWLNNKEQLAIAFRRSLNYLLIISLPITALTMVLAPEIVLIFKSAYEEAIWPLRITILSLVFLFLNFPIGSLLNACDKQKQNTRNMLVVLLFSVALNFILIPPFKALGAGITVLASNFLMFILGFRYVYKIIPYKAKENLIVFIKTLGASGLMALIIWELKEEIPLLLNIIISGLAYFFLLFALGAFKKADLLYIVNSFRNPKKESEEKVKIEA